MTIREQIERNEELTLSPYATFAANSAGRAKEEEPCEIRTCFARDRDRILHCKSFRRLKHKTQVFLAPEGDHYRTRLTHTLEVSQIARTIARALQLNEDLTEAIALGHDLGHTPFGHAGETALGQINGLGFAHYKQSVRVVTELEKNFKGLNLTLEVIDGIENHTKGDWPTTREGQIVRLSDQIAFLNHDVEDAEEAGVLSATQIPKEVTERFGETKSRRITAMIRSILDNGVRQIGFLPEDEVIFQQFKDFMYQTVYRDPVAKKEEKKVLGLITGLYHFYYDHPEEMPLGYQELAERDSLAQAVTDYIAGMSDDYAIFTYEKLYVPQRWSAGMEK